MKKKDRSLFPTAQKALTQIDIRRSERQSPPCQQSQNSTSNPALEIEAGIRYNANFFHRHSRWLHIQQQSFEWCSCWGSHFHNSLSSPATLKLAIGYDVSALTTSRTFFRLNIKKTATAFQILGKRNVNGNAVVRLPSRRIRHPRCTQRLTSWAFQGV